MDFNHFFGEWFLVDRLLLAGLTIICFYNPYFIPLYLLQLMILTGQLEFPNVIGYDHTHKSLVLPLLLIFYVFYMVKNWLKVNIDWEILIVLILSVLGSWYLQAGIAKIELNWVHENNLYNLFAASTDAGLFNQMPVVKQFIASSLYNLNGVILWIGLIIEVLFPLIILLSRKLGLIALTGFFLFHLMVYIVSGIFFWQWIVLELCLLFFFFQNGNIVRNLFTKVNTTVLLSLLVFNLFFLKVTKLAWFDCGYINSFTFYIDDGQIDHMLYPTFFAPYDVGFSKNRFAYLRDENVLVSTLGQCYESEIVKDVKKMLEIKDFTIIEASKNNYGKNWYNEQSIEKFKNFIIRFIQNKIAYDPKFISAIDAPVHIQLGENQQNYDIGELKTIYVVYEEKLILPNLKYETMWKDTMIIYAQNTIE